MACHLVLLAKLTGPRERAWVAQAKKEAQQESAHHPPQANATLPTATSAKAPEVSALLMEQADQQRPIKESNGDTPRWARHSA